MLTTSIWGQWRHGHPTTSPCGADGGRGGGLLLRRLGARRSRAPGAGRGLRAAGRAERRPGSGLAAGPTGACRGSRRARRGGAPMRSGTALQAATVSCGPATRCGSTSSSTCWATTQVSPRLAGSSSSYEAARKPSCLVPVGAARPPEYCPAAWSSGWPAELANKSVSTQSVSAAPLGRANLGQQVVQRESAAFSDGGNGESGQSHPRPCGRVLPRVQRQPDRTLSQLLGILPRCNHVL